MIKIFVFFLLSCCFLSCATSSKLIDREFISDDDLGMDFLKTIYFPLNYPIINVSNDEDIVFLVDKEPDFLKDYFNDYTEGLLREEYVIETTKKDCNYFLTIKELAFNEFKKEVKGPIVNVASIRIDYNFKTPKIDTLLFETVKKESIQPFEEAEFEEMCKNLSNNLINKIKELTKE